MVDDNTELKILSWYRNKWNGKHFFSARPWEVDINTSLTTGSYSWVWETGEEIMKDYFSTFRVNSSDFDMLKY